MYIIIYIFSSNPSISKEILIDCINYARNYVEISDEQYQIRLACNPEIC